MTYLEHVSTEILADHAEGLLGESEAGRVEAHLAECEDCRATSLLLASIPEILAADEVGPMPAVYASRIDAAIADLLVNEPPVPLGEPVAAATPIAVSPIGHDPATNNVVDLNSRRKVAVAGLRRVGTIAAGMVLLIAGAALGIQTVGKDRSFSDAPGFAAQAEPTITTLPSPYRNIKVPKNATQGPNGSKVDPKTGAVFLKNGKILLPNGMVIIPGKDGGDPTVVTPAKKTPEPEPAPEAAEQPAPESEKERPRKGGDPLTTAKGRQPAPATEREPRSSAGDTKVTEPAPAGDPAAQPATEAEQTPPPSKKDQVNMARVQRGDEPSADPYVSESGSEYNEDNFAALVMDLVAAARRHNSGSGSYEPSSTSSPTPTPTPSAKMPADFRMPTQWGSFFSRPAVAQQPGRGPAQARFQERVKRCGEQLGFKDRVIAGDIGRWEGKQATIVVVPSPNANQVDGYVFYGNCSADRKVSAESAQWTQRVDKPAPDAEPGPTPLRRTGSVQPGYRAG